MHVHAREQRITISSAHHAHSEVIAVVQPAPRLFETHALSLAPSPHVLRVFLALARCRRILDFDIIERNVHGARALLDGLGVAEQCRERDAVLDANARRANDFRLVALGEHDALRVADRAIDQTAHDSACAPEARLELLAIILEVDEVVRRARRDRGPRHSRRDPEQHARIERKRDEILGTELHFAQTVQASDAVRDVLLRQQRQRARRRHLHLFVDLRSADV